MQRDKYERNKEMISFDFESAHEYIKKYVPATTRLNYVIHERDGIYGVLVTAPIFEGFDSSNGLKKAELQLYFRPRTPYSHYSELQTFVIRQDLNVEYRLEHMK